MTYSLRLALALGLALSASQAYGQRVMDSSIGALQIEAMAEGLNEPWGLGFLPDGRPIVTERGGRLLLVSDGALHEVKGLPQVSLGGQGGLLDILIPADFEASREIYLTYATESAEGRATAVGRGRLSQDESQLEGWEQIWQAEPMSGGSHFGARLVEMPDGTLRLGTGDRGTGPNGMHAQDRKLSIGKVMALQRDGTLLPAYSEWAPGIHSIGHRNIQGAATDAIGNLWVVEHGARGGDELNLSLGWRNYGWPVISYGLNYNGFEIGIGREAPGMEQPVNYWDPSIAPSGLAILQGSVIPQWEGHFFIGSLKLDYIARLDPARNFAEEKLQSRETQRVRDVRQGRDGAIWFLSVGRGALYRLAPKP